MIEIHRKPSYYPKLNRYHDNSSKVNFTHIIFLNFIFLFITIYPSKDLGLNTYIPYYLVGMVVLFIILQKNNMHFPLYFLNFAWWILFINFVQTPVNNFNLLYSFKTSIGSLFPLLAFTIGLYYSNRINLIQLKKSLFFLLLIQVIVVYLQMKGTSLGLRTYWLFGGEKGLGYLEYLKYGVNRYQALGTLGNPNELGVFSIILLTFLLFTYNLRHPICIFSIFSTIYIVFSSQSRTSVILLAVTLFLRIFLNEDKKASRQIGRLLLGIFSVLIIVIVAFFKLGRSLSFNQLVPRYILWENALNKIYSFSDLENFFLIIFGRGISYVKEVGSIDNTYLNVMLSAGFIGLILFIIFIIFMYSQAKNIPIKRLRFLVYCNVTIFSIACGVMDIYFNMKVSFLLFFLFGFLLNSQKSFYPSLKSKIKK